MKLDIIRLDYGGGAKYILRISEISYLSFNFIKLDLFYLKNFYNIIEN
jgi:hypothetical protein